MTAEGGAGHFVTAASANCLRRAMRHWSQRRGTWRVVLGIVAINADYKTLQRFRPRKGSTIRLESTVNTVNGTRRIVDVWLAKER